MYLEQAETKKSMRRAITKKLMDLAFNTGMVRAGRRLWSKSLTVLNYHRIDDPHQEGFDSFQPNISAHPADFDLQIEYLSRWFNVVSLQDVVNWLDGGRSMPHHAALITFDDGYLDNYTNAYPILKKYKFPAVIYLTTGHIGTDAPFYWDLAAYCFFHTKVDHVLFPNGSEHFWKDQSELARISKDWIYSMKVLPEEEKRKWVSGLTEQLNVSVPDDFFRNLMMNWDQAREMFNNRIEFGGHTINHPILTRIPLEQACAEIEGSKKKIEQELGQSIYSFAYPNGKQADLNTALKNLVAQAGYRTAFTLINGPASFQEVKRNPFAIRRIFIGNNHTLPQFAILVNPLNRYRS